MIILSPRNSPLQTRRLSFAPTTFGALIFLIYQRSVNYAIKV